MNTIRKDAHITPDFELLLRLIPRPNETNVAGDIFGGWLMSQIDIAGALIAVEKTNGPVVTVAVKELTFLKPIYAYDLVSFYGKIEKIGTTSITVKIKVFAQRRDTFHHGIEKISDATLVYVAVVKPGEKRKIQEVA
ncbi:MAG: acyl-CoA thioesterase [Gammaproteobacteria bacterium]|nr:acyl-CoA thioesterase [Gammaproteobacteria bacterium]